MDRQHENITPPSGGGIKTKFKHQTCIGWLTTFAGDLIVCQTVSLITRT